ncbi:MAG: tripartite tricarboxylate transporter substrate binding protein [Proteobacteria bacterium]|nr:tripartite tricarboxylate transporter substrate binding protein [Burkholderiales bacterium]
MQWRTRAKSLITLGTKNLGRRSVGTGAGAFAQAGMAVVVAASSSLFTMQARAQEFPQKPVRIVVGPGPDIVARLLGQHFTEAWGQQTLVDPRPGGGGVIAAELVAKSPADGYTLLLGSASYTINAVLQPGPTDLLRDFAAVAFAASSPFVLLVHPSLPVRTLAELVALARTRPGQINYASSGNGTPPHLAGELFKSAAKLNLVHIPYKSAAPAVIDVVAGQVQMMFGIASVAVPQMQAGKLRGLAVTSRARSRLVPDLPTFAESGLPEFEVIGWNGLLAPAATPRAVIARLNAESMNALGKPDWQARLVAAGYEPATSNTPEQFTEYLRMEVAKWTKLVRDTGMKVD